MEKQREKEEEEEEAETNNGFMVEVILIYFLILKGLIFD